MMYVYVYVCIYGGDMYVCMYVCRPFCAQDLKYMYVCIPYFLIPLMKYCTYSNHRCKAVL